MIKDFPCPSANKSGWPWTSGLILPRENITVESPWPKISVVTPSYNQGQFIEETIRSVLMQGYPNLEYIIIDGASTDNTLEIIRKYDRWLATWVSEADRGQSHAVNKGIMMSSGEIIFWLNSDDLLLPGAFFRIADEFNKHPLACMVTGQAKIIDVTGNQIGELRSNFTSWEDLISTPRNSIRQVSTFFTKELFTHMGLLREELNIAMDTELLARFTKDHSPLIINDYLAAFRAQPYSKTANSLIQGYKETDNLRRCLLRGADLWSRYKHNSAANWISLAENNDLTLKIRKNCLCSAARIDPCMLLTHRFWVALKSILTIFQQDHNIKNSKV